MVDISVQKRNNLNNFLEGNIFITLKVLSNVIIAIGVIYAFCFTRFNAIDRQLDKNTNDIYHIKEDLKKVSEELSSFRKNTDEDIKEINRKIDRMEGKMDILIGLLKK
jgi:peptidoglycan hydrolase CwlO-like protein